MQLNNSTQVSSLSRVLSISLVTFYMFVFGYTISRVFLSQGSNTSSSEAADFVVPHQATLWDAGLENYKP